MALNVKREAQRFATARATQLPKPTESENPMSRTGGSYRAVSILAVWRADAASRTATGELMPLKGCDWKPGWVLVKDCRRPGDSG